MTFATIGDITLRYETAGSGGVPLIFINSLGTSLLIWETVAAHFPYTVRYDKRGHGLSDAPPGPYALRDHSDDLSRLVDYLGLDRVVLVGVSVGGMIALDFAARRPHNVEAMVLCDTAGKIGSAADWNRRIIFLEQNGIEGLADEIVARWFASGVSDELRRAGRNMLTRTPLTGYSGTCAAIRDADLRPLLGSLTMPVLVLCGAEDAATPPALVQGLAQTLPNAHFQLIEGAGHLPGWEQPAATIEAIATFLQQLQPSRYQRGMALRRAILGDQHVDRATANATGFDAPFQRLITEYAWGTVWADDGLDRRTRHLITLALLAALGKEHEFGMHVRAMANSGVTPAELQQALHHVAVYAGVPAANSAFAIAKRIFAEGES